MVMPERLAATDPYQSIKEVVGSGPFRFVANERIVGSKVVYTRNHDYVPRPGGAPDWLAGPKIVNFDRVEWTVMPDPGTAAAALQNGEVDWWENPPNDLLPMLNRSRDLRTEDNGPLGTIATGVLNHLYPPFDKPAVRRILLEAISQADFMTAAAGTDPKMWRDGVGIFTPGTPMASDTGMQAITGPKGAAGQGRLEHVHHRVVRAGHDDADHQPDAALERGQGVVRLAGPAAGAGVDRCVAGGAGSGRAAADRRRTSGQGTGAGAVSSHGTIFLPHCLSRRYRRHHSGSVRVLERAAGVKLGMGPVGCSVEANRLDVCLYTAASGYRQPGDQVGVRPSPRSAPLLRDSSAMMDGTSIGSSMPCCASALATSWPAGTGTARMDARLGFVALRDWEIRRSIVKVATRPSAALALDQGPARR